MIVAIIVTDGFYLNLSKTQMTDVPHLMRMLIDLSQRTPFLINNYA